MAKSELSSGLTAGLRKALLVVAALAHASYPVIVLGALAFNALGGSGATAGLLLVLPLFTVVWLAVVLPLVRLAWRGARWPAGVLGVLAAIESWLFLAGSRTPDWQSEPEANDRFAAVMAVVMAVGAVGALVAMALPTSRAPRRDGLGTREPAS